MIEILTNPNTAFLLMTLGLYGLIYEFANPGAFVPGITGAICLLLGAFALNHMPVNYFGLLLMILGIASMTGEAFFRSFGILGLIGAVSFAAGGIIFIDNTAPGQSVSPWLIGSLTLVNAGLLSIGLKMILRTRKRDVTTGAEALRHATGEVMQWSNSKGEVMAEGSVWKARSADGLILKKGDRVKVLDIDGLCLIVQPIH